MSGEIQIDVANYVSPKDTALLGNDYGSRTREAVKEELGDFAELEKKYNHIIVVIGSNLVTMNRSFFKGFLGPAVNRLGVERFFEKYLFECSEHIREFLYPWAESAVTDIESINFSTS